MFNLQAAAWNPSTAMVDWVAGAGRAPGERGPGRGLMVKDGFPRGLLAAALREGTFSRWHFVPPGILYQINLSVILPNSQNTELKVQQFLRSQFKCQNWFCH